MTETWKSSYSSHVVLSKAAFVLHFQKLQSIILCVYFLFVVSVINKMFYDTEKEHGCLFVYPTAHLCS